MIYNYETHVKPYSSNFQLVEIDDSTLIKIDQFVKSVIKRKFTERHHKIDNSSEYKRFFTGTLGEVALERLLDVSGIVDWTVGDSKKYHKPDLRGIGLNFGIKTVDYGLFPVIFKTSYSPEIINISWKNRYVYVCGLASIDVLNEYQSIDLIKDTRLRSRGTKTGFYGFEHLEHFTSLQDLSTI